MMSIVALSLSAADFPYHPLSFSTETSTYKEETDLFKGQEFVDIKYRDSIVFTIPKSLIPCFDKIKLNAIQQRKELRFRIGKWNILKSAEQILDNFYLPQECDLTSFPPSDIVLQKIPFIGRYLLLVKGQEFEISQEIFNHLQGLLLSNVRQDNLLLNTYFLVNPPKIFDEQDLRANFKLDKSLDKSHESAPLCCICSNEKANYVFINCGHLSLGDECYAKLKEAKCPICNQLAESVVKIYY